MLKAFAMLENGNVTMSTVKMSSSAPTIKFFPRVLHNAHELVETKIIIAAVTLKVKDVLVPKDLFLITM